MTSIEVPIIPDDLPHVDDLGLVPTEVDWSGIGDAPEQPAPAAPLSTLIVVILDESGSMEPKIDDVIGGYKIWLRDQQALPDPARLIFTTFNSRVTEIHGAIEIRQARPLAAKVTIGHHYYHPDGSTALYDAIRAGVERAEKDKTSKERVLVLIMTDGNENASSHTTLKDVQETIAGKEATGTWTFAYIGARPEEWVKESGMSAGSTIMGGQKLKQDFHTMSLSTAQYRASAAPQTKDFYRQGTTWDPADGQNQA